VTQTEHKTVSSGLHSPELETQVEREVGQTQQHDNNTNRT